MRRSILLVSVLMLLLAACRKGEIPVKKTDRGTVTTVSLDQGAKYKNQIWYKLNGNRIINQNSRSDWDIEFEAGDNGNHVRLNSAKYMFALNTNKKTFAEVMDTASFNFGNMKQCDRVASLDSSAIGVFKENSTVFIIDLGVDDDSKPIGFKKFQFTKNQNNNYNFNYSNLDGSDPHSTFFVKSNNYNFVQFSFKSNQLQSNIEPPKNDFDLEFTQYTYVFENPYQPYWVCGVLLNRNDVTACKITGKSFESVTLKDTLQFPLANKIDVIGYEWKKWDFALAHYTYPANTYLIKDVEGYFYKLRFLSFVNTSGVNGFPKFEYQKL